jgi:SSS family transporter
MQQAKTIAALDYAGIIFFFCVMILIGFYFYWKTRSTDDFFAGGRMIPGWISGLSYFVTCFSAMAFVGTASVAYRTGGWVLFLMIPLTQVLPALVSAPIAARWQRTGITTVPEFLNQRFGPSTRYFFAIIGIPSRILDNGNRIYVTSVFVGVALGIGKFMGLWGSSFIILAYTFLGGIWAVVATDVIQFFLKVLAVILAAVLGLHFLGGFGSFVNNAPAGYWNIHGAGDITIGYAFALAIITFVNMNGYWSLIQRYTSTPSAREARKVSLVTAFAFLTVMPLIALPPMIARQAIPDQITALMASGLSEKLAAERSYVLMCLQILPAGIMGLVVVAIFSSTMSALSAEFNIISAVCTLDLYKGLIKKGKEVLDNKLLWIGRFTTVVVAVLCTLIGSQIDKLGGAFSYVFMVLGLTSTPTYVPPLLGLFYKKTPGWGANLAFILGLTSGLIAKFGLGMPLFNIVIINSSVTVGACLLTGLLWPIAGERKELVDRLFDSISHARDKEREARRDEKQDAHGGDRPVINRVIAWGCLAFVAFLLVSAFASRSQGGFLPNCMCAIGLAGISGILFLVGDKKKA